MKQGCQPILRSGVQGCSTSFAAGRPCLPPDGLPEMGRCYIRNVRFEERIQPSYMLFYELNRAYLWGRRTLRTRLYISRKWSFVMALSATLHCTAESANMCRQVFCKHGIISSNTEYRLGDSAALFKRQANQKIGDVDFITFDTQEIEFEIVPAAKAKLLRETFIQKFLDTSSAYYRKHIASMRQYADDLFYDGYLWDCLQCNEKYRKECSMEAAADFLKEKKSVFIMWDLLAKERLAYRRFSLEYPKGAIISMQGNFLSQRVVEEWHREQAAWAADCICESLWLPEDIYCFDESMEWYVIFTHEGWEKGWEKPNGPELNEDDYIRICFLHTL